MSEKKFNPSKADRLLSEERIENLQPEKIIDQLGVNKEDVIADLGAGNGFFTLPLAKRTKQNVYAVDLEPKMLELLKQRVEQEQLGNIRYVVSDLEKISLENKSVSKVIAAFVLHEVGSLTQALNEIKRILYPGGKLMVVDWEAVETESGPPIHHRVSSQEMLKVMRESGFEAQLVPWNEASYAIKATI
ncbi:class I SAM-dependent methyltransferase [Halobacillus mangrovi]|uniref:class I SAM-dependent methyltransferase n=1 Tax=Halobacillus mangrovi TaxID=402384 RepID=UPI003D99571C